MNGHMKAHAKHMILGGVGIALVLVVSGAGWQQAITWGLLLACPVGMIGMMWFMSRMGSRGHQHGTDSVASPPAGSARPHEVPQQRVSESVAPERAAGA